MQTEARRKKPGIGTGGTLFEKGLSFRSRFIGRGIHLLDWKTRCFVPQAAGLSMTSWTFWRTHYQGFAMFQIPQMTNDRCHVASCGLALPIVHFKLTFTQAFLRFSVCCRLSAQGGGEGQIDRQGLAGLANTHKRARRCAGGAHKAETAIRSSLRLLLEAGLPCQM